MTGSVYSDTNRRLLFVLSNVAIFTIGLGLAAVSYTHLTLPTIYSV